MIYLKWSTGGMTINPAAFFPASAKEVKKLLSVIEMDTQGEDHIGLLLKHLNDRTVKLEILKIEYSNRYIVAKQKAADYKICIDTGMKPNGLPLSETKLKSIKAEYKEAKRQAITCKKEFDRCEQRKKRIQRNINQIERHNQCGN